ncbi:uncharacterized protein LOC107458760 [Arachis duranensis]|uniref:Uncharacterized protein LOC107458760 n=1 Tax=Arachis duranensis TaxID=130453 RepID=A0A6P4AX71_ARADU|nr:uncharacterized protein LOC107458760 [Arachis duranensis]
MTITEYTSRFEELCRFSEICQGAPEDFAEWKCIKYEGGLRSDIMSFVAPMEIRTFSKLVNKTRVAEECLRKVALDKSDHRSSVREDHGRNLAPRGQDFKRGGNIPQQHQGQNSFRSFNNNNNQGRGREKQAQLPQDDSTYRRCGRYHPNTLCRAGWDVCYYCGGAGHISWNCPEKKNQDARRAPQAERAYTIRANGAKGTDAPIKGNNVLVMKIWTALHDDDL